MNKKQTIHCMLLAFLCVSICAQETAVVTDSKINVRGLPSLIGEVVTQLEKGDKVTILEEVPVPNAKAGEPTNWAKIKLPVNTPVWAFTPFIKDNTVAVSRLNLRAGPGENYSVLGRINKGTEVKQIRTQDQWSEIEAPADAFAYVDASLLKKSGGENPSAIASSGEKANSQPKSTVQPAPVAPEPFVQKVRTNSSVAQLPTQATNPSNNLPTHASEPEIKKPETVAAATQEASPATPEPVKSDATPHLPEAVPAPSVNDTHAEVPPTQPQLTLPKVAESPSLKSNEPLPRRIVRREGIVRPTKSIQAPTWYELVHPETKKTMNYLHEEKLGVDLKAWKGQKVVVTGEEGIDQRWPNVPILELDSIEPAP